MPRRWDERSDVVTPEAVALQVSEANVGSRMAAILIDLTILAVVLWLLNLTIGFVAAQGGIGLPDWVGVTALVVINFVVLFGYPLAFETLAHGKTPGKAALGLRVVTVEGSPVRFRHAAIRTAFWLVDFFATSGAAAVIATLLSRRHQRLGDMVAGTVVVRERTAGPPPRAADFVAPVGFEGYAETIDASGLTSRDYEVLRELLLRAPALQPEKRHEISRRLAATFASRMGHTVPDGVSPEVFLMCLAARYQQRSAAARGPVRAPVDTAATTQEGPRETWGDFTPPR